MLQLGNTECLQRMNYNHSGGLLLCNVRSLGWPVQEVNQGTPRVGERKLRDRKGIWRKAGLPQCSVWGLSVG